MNFVVAGYFFAVAVVAVGLAGFVADCAAVAAVVADYFDSAAVVAAGCVVADLDFAGYFADAVDLDCVVDFAVAVVGSVGLAVGY